MRTKTTHVFFPSTYRFLSDRIGFCACAAGAAQRKNFDSYCTTYGIACSRMDCSCWFGHGILYTRCTILKKNFAVIFSFDITLIHYYVRFRIFFYQFHITECLCKIGRYFLFLKWIDCQMFVNNIHCIRNTKLRCVSQKA